MHVLIIGEETPSGLGDSYARAFQNLGWQVARYCDRRAYESTLRVARTRVGRRLFHSVIAKELNRRIRADLADISTDLVLVLKGAHLHPETVVYLRERLGVPVVNFYPDDPFSNIRSNRLTYGPSILGAYDACFTFARHLIPAYRESGARKVVYLPFARDPELHAPLPIADAPEFDVVFVGTLNAERVRWLEAASRFKLAVFGSRGRTVIPRHSPLRRAEFFPEVYGRDLSAALARAAISLNVMRIQNRGSHNMRSFESPACGAFTLSERTPELVELFREGEEIAVFSEPDELVDQIGFWLANPLERRRIAGAGFQRVEHDTYDLRAATILTAMEFSIESGRVVELVARERSSSGAVLTTRRDAETLAGD